LVVPGTGCGGEKFFSSYHGVAGLAVQAPVVLHWNRKKKEHKGNLLSLRDRTGSASRFPMLAK